MEKGADSNGEHKAPTEAPAAAPVKEEKSPRAPRPRPRSTRQK